MATITEKANKLRNLAIGIADNSDITNVQWLAYAAKKVAQSIITQAKAAERRTCQHEPRDYASSEYKRPLSDEHVIRVKEYRCKKCGKEKVRITEHVEAR